MIGPDELRDKLETLAADFGDRPVAIYLRSWGSNRIFIHAFLQDDELWLTDVGATCAQLALNGQPLWAPGTARAICAAHNAVLMEMGSGLVIFRRLLDDDSLENALGEIEAAMTEVLMAGRLSWIVDPPRGARDSLNVSSTGERGRV